ncbi:MULTISPECIES: GTP 3',8-cyclase MoaA [Methanobacterium]|uniref:Probable GTP 3',8-cyclase n=1 Tax=Methanobacterium formicicum TaxID=2162 RepID=A0A843AQX5_METFO|nr:MULTISPECIES: GTP 3',8-cyclase MoaA [Methanobacterium]KUK74891.1 MAG: putative cyclic pyranopterin monophosphate synthase [Methanobacterium sp. 42_16]MBF4476218.1 GTP 3',8-cyclase MoaA [Methanobacterium formicicum]MDD4810204.1 GTP 3',8-cyclase MoaA [Methanobacterium formicicum]MDI3549019.1 3,8-cyclase [Methanobacterium sp.]
MTVTDNYQRPIISLRISITNRCNVNCFYCHHDGILPQKYEMTPDEIHRIAQVAHSIGVRKIRLSGGEPLIRDDIKEIVSKISSIGFKDVSITTNGTYLTRYADELVESGLNRVNVSLDTLNPEIYRFITKKNYLQKAKDGIIHAAKAGLYPVKVNMVVMKGLNHDEIWDMFKFCQENDAVLQLIELLKTDNCPDNGFIDDYHYKMDDLEEKLANMADKVKTRRFMQDRKKYFVDGGEIEIVKPMDNTQFCKNCTRIRITPEGKLKPCLLRNDNLVNFIKPMREGKSNEELKKLFLKAINNREPFYEQCR